MIEKLKALLPGGSSMRRIGHNTLAYGYSQIVTLGIQFIQIPFFLHYWGTEKYGEWLVLTGVPTMLALLNTGVSQASANRATMEAGAGNHDLVRVILQTSLLFSTCVGTLIVSLVAGSCLFVNWSSMLDLTLIAPQDSGWIISIMAVYLAVLLQGGVTEICFRAADRASLGVFLLANRRMCDLIITATALILDASPIALAISLAVGQIVCLYAIRHVGSNLIGERIFSYRNASKTEFRAILKPALACLGFPLTQVLTMQGGIQILNQVASPTVVVTFIMSRTLMRTIIQVAVLANNALKPELSRLAGKGKEHEIARVTSKISKVTSTLGVAMYAFFVLAGPFIVEIWGKGKINVTMTQLSLVGLHAILNVFWFVNVAVKIAKNKHSNEALVYCSSALFTLLAWILLKSHIPGVLGASLLLAVPELTMIIFHRISHYAAPRLTPAANKC